MFFLDKEKLKAKAVLLGDRLELRSFNWGRRLSQFPLVVALPAGGVVILFRYGAMVFFGANPKDEEACIQYCLDSILSGKLEDPEVESLEIALSPDKPERVVSNCITIPEATISHLQAIADVMAKSVALALHESQIGKVFESIEPIVHKLVKFGDPGQQVQMLLKHIGSTLLREANMIGRVQVNEKPEFLWDDPTLDRFYTRLADDFELADRQVVLDRKLQLITRTAQTTLDVWQARRSLRLEWYIVILIMFEILLDLGKIFLHIG